MRFVKVRKLTFVSVNALGRAVAAHILAHIFTALGFVVLGVIFEVGFMGSLPEVAITVPVAAPDLFLAQALEIIRISQAPLLLVLNLSLPLAFSFRANLLMRTVFIRLEFALANFTAHGTNITHNPGDVKSYSGIFSEIDRINNSIKQDYLCLPLFA